MTTKTKLLNTIRLLFKNPLGETFIRWLISTGRGSKLAPNHYQYKANSMRYVNVRGINMHLDVSDYVGHYIFYGFKDTAFDCLVAQAAPGDVILDIGANIGFTALSLAKAAGKGATVYAFEPDPYNFAQLQKNCMSNKQLSVIPVNVALGAESIQLKLAINTLSNRGGNRIRANATENFSLVNVIKLDDFSTSHNVTRINLIKIDVEGYEYNILKGAEASIAKFSPVLFIELDDNNLKEQNRSARELIQLLNGMGYSCVNAENNNAVSAGDNFTNCHYDILCKKGNA